jgi:hypothetical protein
VSFILIKIYSCISWIATSYVDLSWWNIISGLLKLDLSNRWCSHIGPLSIIILHIFLVLINRFLTCYLSSNSINSNNYSFYLCFWCRCWSLNNIIDLLVGWSFINIEVWCCWTVCYYSVIIIYLVFIRRNHISVITTNSIISIEIGYFSSSLRCVFINFYSRALIWRKWI